MEKKRTWRAPRLLEKRFLFVGSLPLRAVSPQDRLTHPADVCVWGGGGGGYKSTHSIENIPLLENTK